VISKVKKENIWDIQYVVNTNKNISKTRLLYRGVDINATRISSPNKNLNSAVIFLIDTSFFL